MWPPFGPKKTEWHHCKRLQGLFPNACESFVVNCLFIHCWTEFLLKFLLKTFLHLLQVTNPRPFVNTVWNLCLGRAQVWSFLRFPLGIQNVFKLYSLITWLEKERSFLLLSVLPDVRILRRFPIPISVIYSSAGRERERERERASEQSEQRPKVRVLKGNGKTSKTGKLGLVIIVWWNVKFY